MRRVAILIIVRLYVYDDDAYEFEAVGVVLSDTTDYSVDDR